MADEIVAEGSEQELDESARPVTPPPSELPLAPNEIAKLIPSAAEERLIEAATKGNYCIFDLEAPEEERTIRAVVLRALLMGARPDWSARLSRIALINARVKGQLDVIHVRRRDDRDAPLHQLYCRNCQFEDSIYLAYASIEGLEFEDCEAPNVYASGLKIHGQTTIKRCAIKGVVNFESAEIGGNFSLEGSTLARAYLLSVSIAGACVLNGLEVSDGSESAFSLNSASIGGGLFLRYSDSLEISRPFSCRGEFNAVGSEIKGGVYVLGAQFDFERGTALNLRQAVLGPVSIKGVSAAEPFRVRGVLSLAFAQIATSCILSNGVLEPTREVEDAGLEKLSVNLERATITGMLQLEELSGPDGLRPEGIFRLTSAHVGELRDNPTTAWPRGGALEIQGFTYEAIDFGLSDDGDRSKQRLSWLSLQDAPSARFEWASFLPRRKGFYRPQPYEQLARVLRTMGYAEDADDIAVAKRVHRNRCRADHLTSRLASRFVGLTSRYGYSPGRAALSALVVLVIGWAGLIAAQAYDVALFLPIEATLVSDAPAVRYVYGLPDAWLLTLERVFPSLGISTMRYVLAEASAGCPALVTPLYALDLALPVLDLGQESACRMETRGLIGGLVQTARVAYQILGAIMTAILITTMTGVLRRD